MNRIPLISAITPETVREWMQKMNDAGLMFHTEDDPADIICLDTDEPTFNEEEVGQVRAIIARIRDALGSQTEDIAFEVVLAGWPTP